MQSPIQKFRQSPSVFQKPGIVWKDFDELQLPYSSIFFAKTSHTFPAFQYLQKSVGDFFNFV